MDSLLIFFKSGHGRQRRIPRKQPNRTRHNVSTKLPPSSIRIMLISRFSYAFDVDPTTDVFTNRRVFAYADTGVPDGVQIDAAGNVYAGCGDGVQVWSPTGTLLGKFFLGTTSANMIFAGDGNLVIMAETKIFVAKIAAKEGKVAFP